MDEPQDFANRGGTPGHTWTESEFAMIAEAEADVAAGRFHEWARIDAWWDALRRGEDITLEQFLNR